MGVHRSGVRALCVLVVLALTALACGGDDDGDGDDGSASATSGSGDGATSEFGEPLRVMGTAPVSFPFIGADAALALGIFEDLGLEVEISSGAQVVEGLAAGDIDIGLSSPNRIIGAVNAGLEATIVGPTMDIWDQYVIVRSGLDLESLEDWPEDFRRFGITGFGSSGHYASVKLAQELGWEEGEYEFVTVGSVDGLLGGIRNDTHDVFLASAEYAFALEAEGSADIFGSVGDLIGPNPLDIISVTNQVLEERPEAVRAFCDGYYEAQRQLKEQDVEATAEFLVEEFGYDPAITTRVVEEGRDGWSVDSSMTEEMFDNMAEATVFTVEETGDLTGEDVAEMYQDCSEI